jgi:phosphate transport system permease protein
MAKGDLMEKLFKYVSSVSAWTIISVFTVFFITIFYGSLDSIFYSGIKFIFISIWDPVKKIFGALPFIYGTLLTSLVALILAIPISLGVAIASSELLPSNLSKVLDPVIELMAAIPSIVYGMWALFVLGPVLRVYVEPFLNEYLGFLPLFQGTISGYGYLNASIILFIMILPIISSLSREAIRAVPNEIKEMTLALGGTEWEAIRMKISVAKRGIIGAITLGFSRAVGETMAVLLVIGNKPVISASLFSSGATIASILANEYPEAIADPLHTSALNELALILFLISLVINIIFIKLVRRRVGVI